MEDKDSAEVIANKNETTNNGENDIENVLKKDQIEEKVPSKISDVKDSVEVESSQKEKYDNVVAEIKNQNSLKNYIKEAPDKKAITESENTTTANNINPNFNVDGRCSVDSIEISEENDEIKDLMTRPKFSMQSQLSNMSTASSISGNGNEIPRRKIERVDTDDTTSIDTNITLNEEIIIDPRKIQGAAPTQISERFIA